LGAELAAARAQLKASQAQVSARQAEAAFSRTTNDRWRDSPKGVVSDQEREAKKADYESAEARLYAANAQVALDKSRVDQYSALAQFKKSRRPSMARSPNAGSMSAISSPPAAHRPPRHLERRAGGGQRPGFLLGPFALMHGKNTLLIRAQRTVRRSCC
jgi:multidrug efflux pump subunit AcrA (membrane-fusion protein)